MLCCFIVRVRVLLLSPCQALSHAHWPEGRALSLPRADSARPGQIELDLPPDTTHPEDEINSFQTIDNRPNNKSASFPFLCTFHANTYYIDYIKMQAQNVMNIVVHAMRMLNVVHFYFIGICLVSNSGGHPWYTFSIVSLYDGWQVQHKRFTQLVPRPHFMPAYSKPPLCRMCATIY